MEEKKKRVSVALAAYNGLPYIREQAESILKNLTAEDELVVSDDGSTDGTLAFLEELAGQDPRVRIISGPKKGIKKNFEHAVKNCRGSYIFLSDQDDLWAENKVETVLAAFKEHRCTLVMHDAVVVNEDNTEEIMPSFLHTGVQSQERVRISSKIPIWAAVWHSAARSLRGYCRYRRRSRCTISGSAY